LLTVSFIILLSLLHSNLTMAAPSTTEGNHLPTQKVVCENKPDASLVDKILNLLSGDETEQAARASSYRYLVASSSSTEDRDQHAKAMIERYVIVEQKLNKNKSPDEWESAVCTKIRRTLEYRVENQVDDIRLCFDKEKQSDDGSVHARLREGLAKRFSTQASIIRGYTKEGQAMFQNFPRADTSWDEEFYIKGNIYMTERALASTERRTNGEQDKVVIFYDYKNYAMKNSPPTMLVKQLMSAFRDHWPERMEHAFVVDAPLIFRAFWAIIKYFIDPVTKELVQFITGEEQKKIFRDMISEDQAAPWMFDGGKDDKEADITAFLYDTPFDHVYDGNN